MFYFTTFAGTNSLAILFMLKNLRGTNYFLFHSSYVLLLFHTIKLLRYTINTKTEKNIYQRGRL